MYMDGIKVFYKKGKRTGDLDTNNRDIQPGYWNGIWHGKMCHTDNEKEWKRISKRNWTTKSTMHKDAWREEKL